MSLDNQKNVLICPLDWGIGHAARCVPIIQKFINANAKVVIAADKLPLAFLKTEFPALTFVKFSSYNVEYPDKGSMVLKMVLSIPKILFGIVKEHKSLKKIINDNRIDIVFSDNRYGLWSNKIYSIFMTHQLMVKCPENLKFIEPLLNYINKFFIRKYNECWVPDFKSGFNLTGDLSHKYKLLSNTTFINPLSRFSSFKHNDLPNTNDILVILSGLEPQRTILQGIIIAQLKKTVNIKAVIVEGLTDKNYSYNLNDNLVLYSQLNSKELFQLINTSKYIISRPGYSTIMDIALLGRKAIFIPTPGQTEQEYLAEYLYSKSLYFYQKQKDFNLIKALENVDKYTGLAVEYSDEILNNCINNLLVIHTNE